MLSDSLSDFVKLSQLECSNYQICSTKLKLHMLIYYNSKTDLKWVSWDQDALGHPQHPHHFESICLDHTLRVSKSTMITLGPF